MHALAMVNALSFFFCWLGTHHTAAHHSYCCSCVTCLLHRLRSCTRKREREEEVLHLAEGTFPMLGGSAECGVAPSGRSAAGERGKGDRGGGGGRRSLCGVD